MDLKYFLFILCFGLSSCSSSNNRGVCDDELLQVKVFPTKENVKRLYASEIITDLEYIPLETSEKCLINENYKTEISENYILVSSKPHLILFSRQGKYIRNIGSQGPGPEEYSYPSKTAIDEKSGMIYNLNYNELTAYRISGEFVKKLYLKDIYKKAGINSSFNKIVHWKENLFCANVRLYTGIEDNCIVIFSLDGQIMKLFPNSIKFKRPESNVTHGRGADDYADVYVYKGQLKYRYINSDTLFRLNDQLEFIPDAIFDLCGRNAPENIRVKKDADLSKYTYLMDIKETENYFSFLCDFGKINPQEIKTQGCLYDKKSKKLIIFKVELLGQQPAPEVPSMPGVFINNSSSGQLVNDYSPWIINDIDGGLDFGIHGSHISIIQSANQFICARYQPHKLLKDLNIEHFASKKIKNKEAHERLKKLLENLDEEDNPVIMIATFK